MEDFGLIVTLNCVDPNKIKSIDRMTLDSISQQSRIQAVREANIGEFGLDIEQDLLRAVTGTPLDQSLGTRLTGKDALHATVRASLSEIPELLTRYLSEYGKQDFKTRFPWVEQIREVNDPTLKATLDSLLVDKLRTDQLGFLWLSIPEMMDWEGLEGIKYRSAKSAQIYPDVHIRTFLGEVEDRDELDEYALKKRFHVYAIGSDNETVVRSWTIYRCLYCEVAIGADNYLLSNARWFKLAADFVTRVNEAIGRIPMNTVALPNYMDKSEAAYCTRVAAPAAGQFALMDRKLIKCGGMPTTVEFCDLYSVERQIIHVKKYAGASAALSHLFAQGVVSASLFVHESEFRREVNSLVPDRFRLADPDLKPTPGDYHVVFAIISRSRAQLILPFFSRVNLKNAYSRLGDMGYTVSVTKISLARQ